MKMFLVSVTVGLLIYVVNMFNDKLANLEKAVYSGAIKNEEPKTPCGCGSH